MNAPLKQPYVKLEKHDFKYMSQQLAENAESVCQALWPNGKRNGNYWVTGDVHDSPAENEGSFRVCISGSYKGLCKDFASGGKGHDLLEGWKLRRGLTNMKEAYIEASEHLGIVPGKSAVKKSDFKVEAPKVNKNTYLTPMSHESLQRQIAQINKYKEPFEWLNERGITRATAEYFALGLPYKAHEAPDGTISDKALIAPVKMRNGAFFKKNLYLNIPGFTINPRNDKHWVAREMSAMTYYADSVGTQRYLFICEGYKDLWRHWQALNENGLTKDFLIISSTNGSGIPDEWDDYFFAKYDKVFLGHDNDGGAGDGIAERVLERSGRECHRVNTPLKYGKDWTDYWNNNGTIEEFKSLLREAPIFDANIEASTDKNNPQTSFQMGRRSYKPLDIRGAYHNGHLYYVSETIKGSEEEEEDKKNGVKTSYRVEKRETVVVRSDPKKPQFFTSYMPKAPKGTPASQRVMRLTDGTLIKKMPQVSGYETWEFDDILEFVHGDFHPRHISHIMDDIVRLLKKTIWLPNEEDYSILAAYTPVTYVQKVFQSVPFILMNGQKGTGKSQVGIFMRDICCNGSLATSPTPAGIFRHVDDAQGFVVFDDLEAIGKTGDNGTDELMQILKASYNQETAHVHRTDMKSGKPVDYDCFGTKMFTNILGSDSVLGSRLFKISTKLMPNSVKGSIHPLTVEDKLEIKRLRKELHAWAFKNVQSVDKEYKEIFKEKSDRDDEIAVPLRVFVNLSGNPDYKKDLEVFLSKQKITKDAEVQNSPEEMLKEALENLVKQGYSSLTIPHIVNELSSLMEEYSGQDFANQVPEWKKPEWVGKVMSSHGWVKQVKKPARKKIHGKNLRVKDLADDFIETVRNEFIENGASFETGTKDARDFCQGCDTCLYSRNGCELMQLRDKAKLSPAMNLKVAH